MPIRGSVDSTFTVRAFNIVRGALAASGVASNQLAWRYFSTPWSTFRPVFRVPEVGYRSNEVLGPSNTHALGMFDAVVRHGIVFVTSGCGLGFLPAVLDQALLDMPRKGLTEVDEASISKAGASYVYIT